MSKVIEIDKKYYGTLIFDDGHKLTSDHCSVCCEIHYLNFEDLELSDFEGLEFDLSNENFFKKIDGYGIELLPINGHSVRVAGMGSNNGYYGTNIDLVLENEGSKKIYDVTECQVIQD
jgi:hypothetical protein